MWVDKGAILVAKTFPLVARSAHWNQCTFKGRGKLLDSPSGKRVALFFTHHHTTQCCVKGILHLLFQPVFSYLHLFSFYLKFSGEPCTYPLDCDILGTNRVRPGRPSQGTYASTKILNLLLSALGKIDQLKFETL